jgi:Tol biopolymer transport system component
MTWGPDDDSLIFAWYTVGNPGLWRASVSSRKTDRVRGLPENAVSVAVSRQGKRLAYSRSVADTNIWEYPLPPVADRSARPIRLISSTRHEQGPQYSPDGGKIAFASTRSGSWEIYVCSNDGTNPIQLTNFDGPPTGTPHWSPDGRQIAFDSRPGGNPDIYVVAAEGSPPRRLTTEATQEILPSWSRDGKWVYFVSNRTGTNQLWKIPPAGGTAVQVTKLGGVHAQESPDGRYVYYSKSLNEPGLWRVPVTGGAEEEVLGSLRTGYWGYWWVVQDGVYYADREESQPNHSRYFLKFFHLPTRKTNQVLEFDKRPYNSGLSISPDRRRILYTQLDQIDTDIMLVENFQ